MKEMELLSFLSDNELVEVEKIPYKDGILVLKFFYDFDEDELKAAKAYANDESKDEEESSQWYDEFYLPYLNDIAIDNVGEILEEAMENFDVDIQYVCYEADEENHDFCEFIATCGPKENGFDIDDVLQELNL
jgi:hypothetical protein